MPQADDLRIVTRDKIEAAKWDALIKDITSLVYPNSWYLDVVSPNWQAIVYNDYEAVFPLPRRSKFGLPYLFQPYFAQQLGLFCHNGLHTELLPRFLNLIQKKYKHIDIHLNSECSHRQLRANFELSLTSTHEEIRAGYSTQTRRNLKKSAKIGVSIRESQNFEAVIELFKATKGQELAELTHDDYKTFETLCEAVEANSRLEVFEVLHDTQLISGAIFFHFNNRITMIMLASSESGKTHAASTFLIDKLIAKYASSELILDFEGSQIQGLARFYKGFGANDKPYPIFKKSIIPFKN